MYGCDSWTIKKAGRWRSDAFELFCWRSLLRVPWITRRSNQPIPKEISLKYSLEGLMLKLQLQYFGHLMQRTHWKRPWYLKRLKAGGEGDDRGWDGWVASPTQWTWVWASLGVGEGQGSLACYSPWGHKESDMTEWLNWTDATRLRKYLFLRLYICKRLQISFKYQVYKGTIIQRCIFIWKVLKMEKCSVQSSKYHWLKSI